MVYALCGDLMEAQILASFIGNTDKYMARAWCEDEPPKPCDQKWVQCFSNPSKICEFRKDTDWFVTINVG